MSIKRFAKYYLKDKLIPHKNSMQSKNHRFCLAWPGPFRDEKTGHNEFCHGSLCILARSFEPTLVLATADSAFVRFGPFSVVLSSFQKMTEESAEQKAQIQDQILQQQYKRALSSFEGIILSQIEVKNRLGDRLNYSIRTGIIILAIIAISILILLLSLSSQVNRIANVVGEMNTHFTAISQKMDRVKGHMNSMEQQVALVRNIADQVVVMDEQMQRITKDMNTMQAQVDGIRANLATVRTRVGGMALSVDHINLELQGMTQEMHRMGKPARAMHKMFPFP